MKYKEGDIRNCTVSTDNKEALHLFLKDIVEAWCIQAYRLEPPFDHVFTLQYSKKGDTLKRANAIMEEFHKPPEGDASIAEGSGSSGNGNQTGTKGRPKEEGTLLSARNLVPPKRRKLGRQH